jgi:exodeoxyribonuclease-5
MMKYNDLTQEQKDAVDSIMDLLTSGAEIVTLGGYAGTGKTTVLSVLSSIIDGDIHFASLTNKAVDVLRSKLPYGSNVSTLHSLLYNYRKVRYVLPNGKRTFRYVRELKKYNPELRGCSLAVVDEASMLSESILDDLASFHIKILAVGDHAQLPPIGDNFNLMESPDIRLEKIVRQERNSPIIKMSILARENGFIPSGDYGGGCMKIRSWQFNGGESPDMILCGRRATRVRINNSYRKMLGVGPGPVVGDLVMCLSNNKLTNVFNGQLGELKGIAPLNDYERTAIAYISMDSGVQYRGKIKLEQFGSLDRMHSETDGNNIPIDLFDYGYCITVHKAQGSEADHVMVWDEKIRGIDYGRWLYTAVTRAIKSVVIIDSGEVT